VLDRLQKDPTSFEITRTIEELAIKKRNINEWISITLYKNRFNHFMSIGDFNGPAPRASILFWRDKEYKQVMKALWDLKSEAASQVNITDHLHKIFPEITRLEFEKQVLNPPES
jgi:hypothetical protein